MSDTQIIIRNILKPVMMQNANVFLKTEGEEIHNLCGDIMNYLLSKGYICNIDTNAVIKGDSND